MRPPVVLLAGGLARRMGGGDKPLRLLAGRPILDHVLDRIRPQTDAVLLNANGIPDRFQNWDLPVIPDTVRGQPGPLAGILAGMEWVEAHAPAADSILSVPADLPFLPPDLVEHLRAARDTAQAEIAVAMCGDRDHPAVALWPVRLAVELRHALLQEDVRKVRAFARRYIYTLVPFQAGPVDPFHNINDVRSLEIAEAYVAVMTRHAA